MSVRNNPEAEAAFQEWAPAELVLALAEARARALADGDDVVYVFDDETGRANCPYASGGQVEIGSCCDRRWRVIERACRHGAFRARRAAFRRRWSRRLGARLTPCRGVARRSATSGEGAR